MAIEVKNYILPAYIIVSCKQTKEKEDTCGGGCGDCAGEVVKSRPRAHA